MCARGARGRGGCGLASAIRYTLRYINLAELALRLVAVRGPMHLCACVSKECVDGEGADATVLSDALRYVNLAERMPLYCQM